ncbi:MAG: hypothetical protein V1891_02875 [bacterium]
MEMRRSVSSRNPALRDMRDPRARGYDDGVNLPYRNSNFGCVRAVIPQTASSALAGTRGYAGSRINTVGI